MKFRTEIRVSPFSFDISHDDSIVLLGSCFSNNIGLKLKDNRFNALINPHGIVFNPNSLSNLICNSVYGSGVDENSIINQNGTFHSFQYHSRLGAQSVEDLIQKITVANVRLSMAIKKAKVIFITLGTAWVYRHIKGNKVVANCHKVDQKEFQKELLTSTSIEESIKDALACIKKANENTQIVFTISPVRHIKDGIVENQRSKGLLHSAVQTVVETHSDCHYFQAYEIMMDDLREYRFYEKDLIHPNELAVEYIWQKFSDAFFTNETILGNALITKLKSALNHQLLINNPQELGKFVKSSIALCERIEDQLNIELNSEKHYFENLSTKKGD